MKKKVCRIYEKAGSIILQLLVDELDLFKSPGVEREIQEELKSVELSSGSVILDINSLSYIDSIGVVLLVNLKNYLEKENCTMTVVSESDSINHLFSLLRMDQYISLSKTLDDAFGLISHS